MKVNCVWLIWMMYCDDVCIVCCECSVIFL